MPARTENSSKRLTTFLVITAVLVTVLYLLIIVPGDGEWVGTSPLAFLLNWAPGIAALTTVLLYQRNLRGLGWGWGRTRYQLVSYFAPFAMFIVVYALVWLTGLGGFYNETFVREMSAEVGKVLGLHFSGDTGVILFLTAWSAIPGFLIAALFALGEEIGWRGLMVPELAKRRSFTQTALLGGVIWAVFHFPAIIFLNKASVGRTPIWYQLLVTTIGAIGISTAMAWLRLKSGSLWTAVIFHAVLNAMEPNVFVALTRDTGITPYIIGDTGIAPAIGYAIVAYLFWRKRDRLPQTQIQTPS